MSDARRQLRNARKLVRLRLVEQSRASMQAAEAREHVRSSKEALAAAEQAIEAEDAAFSAESSRWNTISSFEAALEKRTARTSHAAAQARAVEDAHAAQDEADADLRAHDARLSAAEQLVLIHRQRLRRALDRLEQSITDDLSVLKKGREP